ncbi:MAG: helix-turn-helix transcriptional regulator, partial [Campylobacterota bacterium]|nr:helix-turn-helix transcriptional regulator [Campylobacterota bacterium]
RDAFKQKRLSLNLTQDGLANRSGVSHGSIKRFESSSEISLKSLLKLAVILECLDDFTNIAKSLPSDISSIDELLKQDSSPTLPKRGKIK